MHRVRFGKIIFDWVWRVRECWRNMFTGLIEEVAIVLEFAPTDQNPRLRIRAPRVAAKTKIGDSVAVNGCCLTVVECQSNQIAFDVLEETLNRTNFRVLHPESQVNLEQALAVGGKLGGHFVQGHIDCAASVIGLDRRASNHRLEIDLPSSFAHYVVEKGSVAVNGVSLTVAEFSEKSFVTWIIPHTYEQTNLGSTSANDLVNLEFDLIAKYLERLVDRHASVP
jgi:riboflavin synthase